MKILWCIIIILLTSFSSKKQLVINYAKESIGIQDAYAKYDALFSKHPEFISKDFDFPVGKPNGKGYYNAQKFKSNNHLGDDWNGVGGGNSDLGDSIYSIANGYVSFAEDIGGGWGNVIRIIHKYKDKYYESLYAHCKTITIKAGDFVKKGDLIGTIGNADGLYLAHLHLEIRDDIFMGIGGGYSENTKGYLDPTKFINEN
ncbi:M23 family metallopeptidase [uncultured Aquimarina sp.]|uniref:M23 family metallopeptidase n=1 Tax=uncultured Aquimarina sp. TaxID=575652 RepID=UPI0026210656|nr:M23 family metallopeptidase [uncultured Aquimarina sp.]